MRGLPASSVASEQRKEFSQDAVKGQNEAILSQAEVAGK